jgi:hypothetical protein
MELARILAYVTGTVDQELLLRNEYLAAENRILKAQLKGLLTLSDTERATLGEIGRRLGRKLLGEVANVARPNTILAWYVAHYHAERNHQGKSNVLLFPRVTETRRDGPVQCRERAGWALASLPSRGRVSWRAGPERY